MTPQEMIEFCKGRIEWIDGVVRELRCSDREREFFTGCRMAFKRMIVEIEAQEKRKKKVR